MEDFYIERELIPHEGSQSKDQRGFLYSFEYKNCKTLNDAFTQTSCIVLLGEGAIGKTTFLHKEYKKLKEEDKHWVDLANVSNEESLIDEFFNEDFDLKTQHSNNLTVFVDNLDIALYYFPTVFARLCSKLKKHDLDKIKLIITCRPYLAPKNLEAELKKLFSISSDECILYDLAVLKYEEFNKAIENTSLYDTKDLLEQISKYNLTPFMFRPNSLTALLKMYSKGEVSDYLTNWTSLIEILTTESNPSWIKINELSSCVLQYI